MPPLISFMIRHFVIGVGLGLVVVVGVIWKDVFSLGQLIESPRNYGLCALFTALMSLTFGTVQMSVAVMTAPDPGRPTDPVPDSGPQSEQRTAEIARRKDPHLQG